VVERVSLLFLAHPVPIDHLGLMIDGRSAAVWCLRHSCCLFTAVA